MPEAKPYYSYDEIREKNILIRFDMDMDAIEVFNNVATRMKEMLKLDHHIQLMIHASRLHITNQNTAYDPNPYYHIKGYLLINGEELHWLINLDPNIIHAYSDDETYLANMLVHHVYKAINEAL